MCLCMFHCTHTDWLAQSELRSLSHLTYSVSRLNISFSAPLVALTRPMTPLQIPLLRLQRAAVCMTCGTPVTWLLWHASQPLAPTARQCGQQLHCLVTQLPSQCHPSLVSRMTCVSSWTLVRLLRNSVESGSITLSLVYLCCCCCCLFLALSLDQFNVLRRYSISIIRSESKQKYLTKFIASVFTHTRTHARTPPPHMWEDVFIVSVLYTSVRIEDTFSQLWCT